ncbi:hypothetical protein WN943_025090 [Citrus x changshan-huyou]
MALMNEGKSVFFVFNGGGMDGLEEMLRNQAIGPSAEDNIYTAKLRLALNKPAAGLFDFENAAFNRESLILKDS